MTSCASINSYTGPDELHKSTTHITGQVDTGTAQQQQMDMKTRLNFAGTPSIDLNEHNVHLLLSFCKF